MDHSDGVERCPTHVPVVAVLGHYGNRNLGDEAIVAATLAGLRRGLPSASLFAVSLDPADTAHRHGVAAFPLRRNARSEAVWRVPSAPSTDGPETKRQPAGAEVPRAGHPSAIVRSVRYASRPLRWGGRGVRDLWRELRFLTRVAAFLRRLDLVVIAGSNQFLDNFGGARGFPYTLLAWTVLARLVRTPVTVTSVGAGPLTGRSSRLMIRAVVRMATRVSYRDAPSRALIEGEGGLPCGDVRPDLAFALRQAIAPRSDGVARVGVNVMPVYDARYWPDDRPERYGRYVDAMAEVVAGLLERDLEVFLYATQPSDARVIEDVQRALGGSRRPGVVAETPSTVDELMTVIGRADMLVTTRFHGAVLALVGGRPVVAVCYHRKTADVMADAGLERYALALDGLRGDEVLARVDELRRKIPAVYAQIDAVISNRVHLLEQQFTDLALLARLGTSHSTALRAGTG